MFYVIKLYKVIAQFAAFAAGTVGYPKGYGIDFIIIPCGFKRRYSVFSGDFLCCGGYNKVMYAKLIWMNYILPIVAACYRPPIYLP